MNERIDDSSPATCSQCGSVMDCDLMTGTPHCQCEYAEPPRCDYCIRECVFAGTRNDAPCPRFLANMTLTNTEDA